MIGAGSLAHNRRDFVAENVNPDRVQLNICYKNENLKEVYKELFNDVVERYNVGKRKDRQIANYYEKIRQGKQEKLFHEVIFQIGNREDMAVGTSEGNLAVKVLDEYVKDFQKRNPTLRVFSCYLHQDEATPHLHIDFVPYVTNWKGKGMDTRVSLKQALKSQQASAYRAMDVSDDSAHPCRRLAVAGIAGTWSEFDRPGYPDGRAHGPACHCRSVAA